MTINRSWPPTTAPEAPGDGGGAAVLIGESVVTGNTTGVAQLNGASVSSYKNNQIDGNGTNIVGTLSIIPLN